MKSVLKFISVLLLISGAVFAGVYVYNKFFKKDVPAYDDECDCFE